MPKCSWSAIWHIYPPPLRWVLKWEERYESISIIKKKGSSIFSTIKIGGLLPWKIARAHRSIKGNIFTYILVALKEKDGINRVSIIGIIIIWRGQYLEGNHIQIKFLHILFFFFIRIIVWLAEERYYRYDMKNNSLEKLFFTRTTGCKEME